MFHHTHPALIALILLAMLVRLPARETNRLSADLVIGLLVPPEEPSAASLRDGATLGVEEWNQSPGPRARLVIRGRAGQWGADGVEAARMVTDDGAAGLIAPPDGAASHLVLQVSGRTAVPVISLCADSSVTQTGVPWMVRIVPSNVEEAKMLFAHIQATRWLAMIPDGRAGRETARDLNEAAVASGCSIAKLIEFNPSFTNTARLTRQMLTNRPGAILLWLDPAQSGKLAKVLRAAGYAGTLAGSGRLRSADFATAAGEAGEGLLVPAPVLAKDAGIAFQTFSAAFRNRFDHEPDATAAASYDASRLLIHLVAQPSAPPAHEAFPINFSFAGASGNLAFDSRGNRQVNLQLLQAHGGQFIPVDMKAKNKP